MTSTATSAVFITRARVPLRNGGRLDIEFDVPVTVQLPVKVRQTARTGGRLVWNIGAQCWEERL